MKTLFVRFVKDESGVTAIEYGLIAGLISVLIMAAVTSIGTSSKACSPPSPRLSPARKPKHFRSELGGGPSLGSPASLGLSSFFAC